MAFLKFSSNVFLGLPELKYLKESLDDQGFRLFIKENSSAFGFIKNPTNDYDFSNAKVEQGTNSGTIKIGAIFGIDSNGLFLKRREQDLISVASSISQWFWVKASHEYSNLELGLVTIATNGTLTGNGTDFLSKLRGQPNYPSKISFPQSSINTQEYQVVRVIDDQNVILSGSFTAESNLRYAVVGTFTPAVPIPNNEKYPLQKDSCKIELITESSLNEAPSKIEGKEFWIARIRNNSGTLLIEDKRNEIWSSADSFSLKSRFASNKFIGVEAIKFSDEFSTKEENILEIGWGLRTENHTASSALRQITISNGEGGSFKKDSIINSFTNGDFDGWRIYFKNGNYSRIIDSVIDAGSIQITLDVFDPINYSAEDQLFICPDVEEVIIRFRNDLNLDENNLVNEEISFPVNTPICKLSVLVPSNTSYLYNLAYRHKNNNQYSEMLPLPNGSFFDESSFEADGTLKTNVPDRNVVVYNSHPTNGFVLFTSNPNSFNKSFAKIDTGDLNGVRYREMSNVSPLISLTVSSDAYNQQIQNLGSLVMSVNQIINLRTQLAKNGSKFFLFIKGPFNTSSGDYTIEIRQDYQNAGTQGNLLLAIPDGAMNNGNIIVFCTYDSSTGWAVNQINASSSSEDVGELKFYFGTLTGKFDSTGLGISSRWFGWALANGANGTLDARQKFFAGLDIQSSEFQMGAIGGANSKLIALANMPQHNHTIHYNKINNGAGANGGATRVRTLNPPSTATGGAEVTEISGSAGGSQPFDVRPSYIAIAVIQKILDI